MLQVKSPNVGLKVSCRDVPKQNVGGLSVPSGWRDIRLRGAQLATCLSKSRWFIVGPEDTVPSISSSRRNSRKSFRASWNYSFLLWKSSLVNTTAASSATGSSRLSLQCGEGTPQVTGWFEVTVGGKLVHSKKNGDGFVDNSAKLHKIITAIKAALA
ncbi:UNVERIFIED_CONTAM: hypothetical protein K2H54_033727 [Gekko kuhli]